MDELEAKVVIGSFVGYPKDFIGYEFYLPNDSRIIIGYQSSFLEEEHFWLGGMVKKVVLKEVENQPQSKEPV